MLLAFIHKRKVTILAMHLGTVFKFKSLLNIPKNSIHPEEKKKALCLLSSSNPAFSRTKQWSVKYEMLFPCVFQGADFFLKTNKRAHRVCLRKNNTTTLQEGGTLTQRRRFRSEYSLLLQHDLKRNLIITNLSNLYSLFRGRCYLS